jgi:hypothetical protein
MRTPATGLALSTFLHSRASPPLKSAYTGRDYSQVRPISHHVVSKNVENVEVPLSLGGICLHSLNDTLLVCDVFHSCVRVFDYRSMQLLHTIGERGGNPGKFMEPNCIAIHANGNFAISDATQNRIQIFSMQNLLISYFGEYGNGRDQIDRVMGLAFTREGNLVLADMGNHRIKVLTETGQLMHMFGQKGDFPGEFQVKIFRNS